MIAQTYREVENGGWLLFAHREALDEHVAQQRAVTLALDAAHGHGIRLVRRSRHGETWFGRLGDTGTDVFIKVLDPTGGIEALRHWLRGARADHVAAISLELSRAGIGAPRVIVYGRERRGGRELIITERAPGHMMPRWLKGGRERMALKRALLRALGAEVARLHGAGFIHGDLTPFNVVVAGDREPPRINFIDHERTRRTPLARMARPRLRNLVQLGRFELVGLTMTDRMRVWREYARAMRLRRARAERNRLARMLQARIARDAAATSHPPVHEAHRQMGEG
jgi:Lipopolysaccharide kinase (Kdo/WaaP) family